MRALLIAVAAAGCAASVAAYAASDPAPNKDDERVICRRGEGTVGSRLGEQRVCRTRGEWRRMDQTTRREVQEFRRQMESRSVALGRAEPAGGPPQ